MKVFDALQLYREFAEDRSDIKRMLKSSTEQRRQNLIQIFVFRNTTTVHHWISELYGILHLVSKMSSNKKYPKQSFILQEIWGFWEDSFYDQVDIFLNDVERKENKKIEDVSLNNLYNFIKDYHIWLAENLSNYGKASFSQIENKIKELLIKYPIN